ncbi:hypothetical protein AB0F81_44290 [Actinoplanes sp. NPDC024001]|uniref:hypothetical protein n=1 Tax=Actinoplanes sp. NPDC024001 TaxID=3154598 RepID=UPI0033DB6FAB
MATERPDIPAHLRHRPTSGGLVVPVPTPRGADGTRQFGLLARHWQQHLLRHRLCQICGRRLTGRLILFARPADLQLRCTSEPAVCPPCAAYSMRACPMLSGRLEHYRRRARTGVAGVPAGTGGALRAGAPAEAWYAVWLGGYDVAAHPVRGDVLAACWWRHPPLRIRPVPAS